MRQMARDLLRRVGIADGNAMGRLVQCQQKAADVIVRNPDQIFELTVIPHR